MGASGLSIAGIGSAFWALVAGLGYALLTRAGAPAHTADESRARGTTTPGEPVRRGGDIAGSWLTVRGHGALGPGWAVEVRDGVRRPLARGVIAEDGAYHVAVPAERNAASVEVTPARDDV